MVYIPKLPTINVSNVKPNTESWISICNNVRKALEEYGCFVAIFDKVSQDLHNKVFDVIQQLFQLPIEVKTRNSSELPFHGYQNPGPMMPLLESFGIENAPSLEMAQSFTNLMWPNNKNHIFCKNVHEYAKHASELEQLVTRMMFESYGLNKYVDGHLDSTTYLLRIAKYRVPNKGETKRGGIAHTDKNFITILHQNEIDGLEIQTKDGEWINYESSSPHSFVVMAGEPLLAWSNNRIHAPVHRVIMKGKKPRYSLALFSRSVGTMETPKELIDCEHPLQFKPFSYNGFMKFYTDDVNKITMCNIKDYCGV